MNVINTLRFQRSFIATNSGLCGHQSTAYVECTETR